MNVGERLVSAFFNLLLGAGVGALAGTLGYAMPCGEFVFDTVVWSALLFGTAAFIFGPDYGAELAVSLVLSVFLAIFVFVFGGGNLDNPKAERHGALLLIGFWAIGVALILFRAHGAICA